MKKFVLLLVLLTVSSVFASETKTIRIQGEAAGYLYKNHESDPDSSVQCYRALLRGGRSVIECRLSVEEFSVEAGEIRVYGASASEMYRDVESSESVECFRALQRGGATKIGCLLVAEVVGTDL